MELAVYHYLLKMQSVIQIHNNCNKLPTGQESSACYFSI